MNWLVNISATRLIFLKKKMRRCFFNIYKVNICRRILNAIKFLSLIKYSLRFESAQIKWQKTWQKNDRKDRRWEQNRASSKVLWVFSNLIIGSKLIRLNTNSFLKTQNSSLKKIMKLVVALPSLNVSFIWLPIVWYICIYIELT